MLGYVYLFRSFSEKKVYIGQTTKLYGERWTQHVMAAFCGSTLLFHQAIRRLGASDFSEEILGTAVTRAELNSLECRYIEEFQATNPDFGYNMGKGTDITDPVFQAVTLGYAQTVSVTLEQFKWRRCEDALLPLFNCYGERLGSITVAKAREFDGVHLQLRAKGTGRRRRYTSAKLYAREAMKWAVKPSAGFSVLQLVRE